MKKTLFLVLVTFFLLPDSHANIRNRVLTPVQQATVDIRDKIQIHLPLLSAKCRAHMKFNPDGDVYYLDVSQCESADQQLVFQAISKASPFKRYPLEVHSQVGDITMMIDTSNR